LTSLQSYFDQAVEIASLLNIKLTSRKWNGERVAMCGFPIPHLDRYLKILVQKERRFVAMCEEYARYDSDGIKEFERRISRIITPGTLIDESFLNPFDNNYLLAINLSPTIFSPDPMGLAWIDVSTGESFSKHCRMEGIRDELARLAPREIVLDECMKQHKDHTIFSALEETNCLVSYCTQNTSLSGGPVKEGMSPSLKPMPASPLVASKQTTAAEGLAAEVDTPSNPLQTRLAAEFVGELDTIPSQETSAIALLTKFLQENLLEHMPLLNAPRRDDIHDHMHIDAHTIQGLEIRETGQEGSLKGSLLSVVKRTLTSGGTRLLARWLCKLMLIADNNVPHFVETFQAHLVYLSPKLIIGNLWSHSSINASTSAPIYVRF
jgi:DNA mismatch repair ATPase MutS